MQDKIKEILNKHMACPMSVDVKKRLNDAIIEICREQIEECAKHTYQLPTNQNRVRKSPNIAKTNTNG